MMPLLSAAILVIGFITLLYLMSIPEKAYSSFKVARNSLKAIRNSSLSDEAKEKVLQKDAILLLRYFLKMAMGVALSLLLPLVFVCIFDIFEIVSIESVFGIAASPAFIIMSIVLAIFISFLPQKIHSEKAGYSPLDKCFHYLAFASLTTQVSIASLEDRIFIRKLSKYSLEQPVFITALPRAGTTLLLECISRLNEFASHCYRDMPYILIPCLWDRFSSIYKKKGKFRERAHGDGMLIDCDSPEALEEIVWKTFWSSHYLCDRITPWNDDDNDKFTSFFYNHLRKIIMIRSEPEDYSVRYVSKNNLNIARISLLRKLFPDSYIVVPYRNPFDHAASLLEQHNNFLHIHKEDPFACIYMQSIGHHDFGKNLCPINFNNWMERTQSKNTKSLSFWIEYWIDAYRYLLNKRNDIIFISYEALCNNPYNSLYQLAKKIEIKNVEDFLSFAPSIYSPRVWDVDTTTVEPSIMQKAQDIFATVREDALY